MRTLITGVAALALLLALGTPTTALAEDPPQPVRPASTGGTWLYEIRIVRVDPKAAANSEAGSPFPELTETTIDLPWKTILERLKKRGRTTVLMDTRMSAKSGAKSQVSDERITPIIAINFEDKNNQQYRSQPVKEGCSFEQTTDAQMTYRVQVRGTATPPVSKQAPAQYLVTWNGNHALLAGRTLVLEHRQQVNQPDRSEPEPKSFGASEVKKLTSRLAAYEEQKIARRLYLEEAERRLAEAKRELQATSRRDAAAKLEEEINSLATKLVDLRATLARDEEQTKRLAEAVERVRAIATGGEDATQQSIEHYAFVTGRYVAGK